MSAAPAGSRKVRHCSHVHGWTLTQCEFGECAVYLGQSARRVFTPSEAGKQKRKERCGHSRKTQNRTQVKNLEAWTGARNNLTGAKRGKTQNNYILGKKPPTSVKCAKARENKELVPNAGKCKPINAQEKPPTSTKRGCPPCRSPKNKEPVLLVTPNLFSNWTFSSQRIKHYLSRIM